MRKVRELQNESKKAIEVFKALERERERAEMDERELLESTTCEIQENCEKKGLFCGVIMTPKDLAGIVELMATKHEGVKIEFKLYFKEE
jgi:hypothetical protein